ncbi:MAG: DotU family type IV/VI secretion system protein [Azospirillaceae bacterium]|nr:DotU family type IV/VI secretion system protein [Azospirillaceae bacterium]
MLHRRDLVDNFLAFAGEVSRHRQAVARSRPGVPPGGPTAGDAEPVVAGLPAFLADTLAPTRAAARSAAADPLSVPPDPEILLRRLQDYIEMQAAQFGRTATDLLLGQYREVQYAMAALADDLFIHEVEWNGGDIWRSAPLEQAMFRTRLAGERVFDRIDALLASNDRRLVQLAAVYLLLLGLGFKGRNRVPGGDIELHSYSARLFEFVSGREAEFESGRLEPGRTLMPAAYAHTLNDGPTRGAGRGIRWPLVITGLVVVWLLAGQSVWWAATADISSATDQVLQASIRVTH